MIKFIHCADIHLDRPFELHHHVSDAILSDIKQSSFSSFTRLVTDAVRGKVDFVLISGDLYDITHASIHTMVFLSKQFERLKDAGIFVYIVYSETDHLYPWTADWPDNVIVFNDHVETYEFITKSGEIIYIHGMSSQCTKESLEHFPTNQVDQSIHIGMLHTEVSGGSEITTTDLNPKLYHYWALGGIHDRRIVSELPHIHYAGNMQGTSREELNKKGYLLVEGDHASLEVVFVPTQWIRFEQAEIAIETPEKNALFEQLSAFKEQMRAKGKQIYDIQLSNPHETLISQQTMDDVIQLVQQYEAYETNFVWLDTIQLTQQYDELTLHREFADEVEDDQLFNESIDALYHNEEMNRFMLPRKSDRAALLTLGEQRLKARVRDTE